MYNLNSNRLNVFAGVNEVVNRFNRRWGRAAPQSLMI